MSLLSDQGFSTSAKDSDEGIHTSLKYSDRCLFGVLVIAPLVAGTVHPESWLALLALSLGAWLFTLHANVESLRPPPIVTSIVILSGIAVLLPLLPLPISLVALLSPEAAEQWTRGIPGEDLNPTWGVLHRAPGPGTYAATMWATATTFLLACCARAHDERFCRKITNYLLIAALVTVTACLIQTGLQSENVLGLYEPRVGISKPLRATFLNENHFSAFLGLALVLSASELFNRQQNSLPAPLLLLLSIVSGAMILMLPSYSGIGGASIGLATVILLQYRKSGVFSGRRVLRGLGFLVPLLPLLGALSLIVKSELSHKDPQTGRGLGLGATEPRLQSIDEIWQLVTSHPYSGVGISGFLDAYPAVRTSAGSTLAFQPEVLPLKLLSECGLLLGPLLMLLLVGCVFLALRASQHYPTRIGAAGALFSLLVHEQADFATHTGGVLLPAIGLLVVSLPPRTMPFNRTSQLLTASALATLALSTVPVLQHWDLHDEFEDVLPGPDAEPREIEEAASQIWAWHPSSFVLAQEVGLRLAAAGAPNRAMSWLNRAMLLAPTHPQPHLMTARLLRGLGAERQALLEYRIALDSSLDGDLRTIFAEVRRNYSDVAAIQTIAPPDQPRRIALFALYALWDHDPRVEELSNYAAEHAPEEPATIFVRAKVQLADGKPEVALAEATQALQDNDLSFSSRYQLLQILWLAGSRQEALQQLRQMLETQEDPPAYTYLVLARWHHQMQEAPLARIALRRVRRGPTATAAQGLVLEAQLESDVGDERKALRLLHRAQELAPNQVDAWLREVLLLTKMGEIAEARELAERNQRRLQHSSAGRALLDTLQIRPPSASPTSTLERSAPLSRGAKR